MYTREQIETAVKAKAYKWFEAASNKGYDVNIVGIRNNKTKGRVTNAFDDHITISYKIDGEWYFECFKCTTDPGSHWVKNIMREDGVAILKPGQYRGSHKLRLHQGKYMALGQQKPVKVYRDNNLDNKYDLNESSLEEGIFGINIHRATGRTGGTSTRVDKWSAGCQVIANNDDWHCFLDICMTAREIWGNSFTYTLIESKDIS